MICGSASVWPANRPFFLGKTAPNARARRSSWRKQRPTLGRGIFHGGNSAQCWGAAFFVAKTAPNAGARHFSRRKQRPMLGRGIFRGGNSAQCWGAAFFTAETAPDAGTRHFSRRKHRQNLAIAGFETGRICPNPQGPISWLRGNSSRLSMPNSLRNRFVVKYIGRRGFSSRRSIRKSWRRTNCERIAPLG